MFTWTGCELPTVINNGFVYGLHPAEGYWKPWTQVMCSKPSNEDGSTQRITKAEVRMYSECYFRLFHGHYFQSSYPWVGGVCNFHLQWDCRQGDSFFFSQGWQSRISYRSLSCDIPLFRQRELWAVINRREREVRWYNWGGYRGNCNFEHALFSNSVWSVKLQDYLPFEKRWQGNCRYVLESTEVISQHLWRNTSFCVYEPVLYTVYGRLFHHH